MIQLRLWLRICDRGTLPVFCPTLYIVLANKSFLISPAPIAKYWGATLLSLLTDLPFQLANVLLHPPLILAISLGGGNFSGSKYNLQTGCSL